MSRHQDDEEILLGASSGDGLQSGPSIAPGEAPPAYEDRPLEPLDVEEPLQHAPLGRGWLGRFQRFGKNTVVAPVRHIIDPIAHLWHVYITRGLVARFDSAIQPVINPLLARRLLVLLVTLTILTALYMSHHDNLEEGVIHRDPTFLRSLANSYINVDDIGNHVNFFGKMPHLAGSVGGRSTAKYVHETLESLGITASHDRHDILLSHANMSDLWIYSDSEQQNGEEEWHTLLLENESLEKPLASQQQPRPQMALALPGDARGPLVYVHEGSQQDLQDLGAQGISVKGAVVFLRRSQESPGIVVKRLEDAGAVAAILVNSRTATPWPEGPDFADGSVQLGSLGLANMYPGDVLSPGWPSSMAMVADLAHAYIPQIPVTAISRADARKLTSILEGEGKPTPGNWDNQHLSSWTGPTSTKEVRLRIDPYLEQRHQISNIFGRLPGVEQDNRIIMLGARMDSFCYGASELAGLAVLLQVAKALAYLRFEHGWQPLRTIYFVAWDGTDQNFAGATEWVEAVADSLSNQGLAYIDLDGIGADGRLVVQGNPLVEVESLLKLVKYEDGTLWDALDAEKSLVPLPGFGNWLSFDAHTGVPSVRIGFDGVAPRQSCFDTPEWLAKFGDPNLEKHRAMAELAVNLALDLSTMPILPYNPAKLGSELHKYVNDLKQRFDEVFGAQLREDDPKVQEGFALATKAADAVTQVGVTYTEWQQQWQAFNDTAAGSTGFFGEPPMVAHARMYWNERISSFNKMMLDRNGIHHRNWYKHHLFGPQYVPQLNETYTGTFPGVRDALNVRDYSLFASTLSDAAYHIMTAAKVLDDF